MYDAQTIAEQLTLIDHNLYRAIRVTELLNQSWNSPKLKHRSPNLIFMIGRSTKVSFWIASSILYLKLEKRIQVLEKIIDICDVRNISVLSLFFSAL